MTDFSDRASERELEINSDALEEQHLHDPTVGKTVADSALVCDGCGETIAEGRRIAVPGVRLCFDCQDEANWLEARRRQNGKPV
jgi:phage/conjugal plasmid C-4 type zinc finger TraR family protein